MRKLLFFFLIICIISCNNSRVNNNVEKIIENFNIDYFSDGFDFPVGKPNAENYYNAQGFGENDHLGDDWNGVSGGNTDLGDPIYAIANGYVNFTKDIGGGWGNVIRITHVLSNGEIYESIYAHCNEIFVKKGDYLLKGDEIGSIGTANGQYLAHLHLELRDQVGLPIGGGYSKDTTGYLNPTTFIKNHRY